MALVGEWSCGLHLEKGRPQLSISVSPYLRSDPLFSLIPAFSMRLQPCLEADSGVYLYSSMTCEEKELFPLI